jgi:hypothetical protein
MSQISDGDHGHHKARPDRPPRFWKSFYPIAGRHPKQAT